MGYGVNLWRNQVDFDDSKSEDGVTPVYDGGVTFNFSTQFAVVLGDKRLYELYGKTGEESIPMLEKAISFLLPPAWGQEEYGHREALNASAALTELLVEARKWPDGVWSIC